MAKKNDTKKNKKTKAKKLVENPIPLEQDIKDAFINEAMNTIFTEDDVKEMVKEKESDEVEEITEPVIDEDETIVGVDVADEAGDKGTTVTVELDNEGEVKEIIDVEEHKADSSEVEEGGVEQEEKTIIEPEEEVKEETPKVVKVEEKPAPKKRRTTSKEAYGYHWMGLVYDE